MWHLKIWKCQSTAGFKTVNGLFADKEKAVMITVWQQQTHAHLTLTLQNFLHSLRGGDNNDYIKENQQGEEECELKLQALKVWNIRVEEEHCVFLKQVKLKFHFLHLIQAREKQHKAAVSDGC